MSSLLAPLIEKLGNLVLEESKFLLGVKGQIESLKRELIWIHMFLIEMDKRQLEDGDETLLLALRDIREVAHDAEDVIDSLAIEAKAKANVSVSWLQRSLCSCASPVQTHRLGSDVEAINDRTDEITKFLQRYRTDLNLGGEAQRSKKVRTQRSYPFDDDDYVVGLEEDINKLVTELTNSENKAKLVSVVGMGGSGKTTLARKLYNNHTIKEHFQFSWWVSVSQEWVTKDILVEIISLYYGHLQSSYASMSLGELVAKLQGFLQNRLYMIVLDDVWRKEALEEILPAFPLGNNGSKIVVTTRNQEVVQFPNMSPWIHESTRLKDEHSWELFSKIVLNQTEDHALLENHEELAKEMLKKCEGLPLAIIALGGLLGQKGTIGEWNNIRNAVSSKVMESGRGTHLYGTVKHMMTLSYNDLSYELKPCFLYLGIFPENYEIKVGLLIKRWIAEGFIKLQRKNGDETLEDVAREYVNELVLRRMVLVKRKNYRGEVKSIQIHDLMRDLSIRFATEQNFLEVLRSREYAKEDKIEENTRRTSVHFYASTCLPPVEEQSRLRSLSLFGKGKCTPLVTKQHREDYNFRLLRVLHIENIMFRSKDLPFGIGNLIHLTYLGIKSTNISKFPESIAKLVNLMTLDYQGYVCPEGERKFFTGFRVPDVLWKIKELRHVYLSSVRVMGSKSFPEGMESSTPFGNLQTLWGVIPDGDWSSNRAWMRTVKKLGVDIYHRSELEAALNLSGESYKLETLSLDWSGSKENYETMRVNPEPLSKFKALEKLTLKGPFIDRQSLSVQFPPTIQKIELMGSRITKEETLKVLGKLPSLRFLTLSDSAYTGDEWTCKKSEFPQLEELYFNSLCFLRVWEVESGALCKLKKLSIWSCRNLKRLPEGLESITTLQHLKLVYTCEELLSRLEKPIENAIGESTDSRGEDFHIIQGIQVVEIS